MIFLRKKKEHIDKSKPYVKIGILNIMPDLRTTEQDLLKVLDIPFLQVEIDFIYLDSFTNDKDKIKYLKKNYYAFKSITKREYDGIIITGAPLEHFKYSDISYIKEFNAFLEYTKTHAKNTLFLCWASEYALYYFYQVKSDYLNQKLSGLYPHYIVNKSLITTWFDNTFLVPISRYCVVRESDILENNELKLISKSNETGALLIENKEQSRLFMTGHFEYQKNTLELEYIRDFKINKQTLKPFNYYLNNHINYNWQAHQFLFYQNWLYYYVYLKKYV